MRCSLGATHRLNLSQDVAGHNLVAHSLAPLGQRALQREADESGDSAFCHYVVVVQLRRAPRS